MSDDSAQTQQTNDNNNNNKSGDPASRFLVGILGTLFALLAICTIVLLKPRFLRAIGRLETARQQRVAVDRTIEKRRRARKPKLRECWIDSERRGGNRSHGDYGDYGTRWADLQPLGAELEYAPPPLAYATYASVVAPAVAVPVPISPVRPPRTEFTRPSPSCRLQLPHQPHQRPLRRTPIPDGLVQLTLFVAMPTPSRPLYPSCHLPSTSTSPSPSSTYHDYPPPDTLPSSYTHHTPFTGINIQHELNLGVILTPFIPARLSSLPSAASEAQKQSRP